MNPAVTEPKATEGEYLTQGGLAELLRVSVRTVQRRARHPNFPEPICVGRCYRWPKNEVLERVDQKMTSAFHAVADLAEETGEYMRDAAYMIAIQRVATACHLRGWA